MRQIIRLAGIVLLVAILLCAAIVLLNPNARKLTPIYLYYDAIGRRIAPAPPELEQFVLQNGQEYCSVGHDSDCGGYRFLGARSMAVGPVARRRGTTATWCVDYIVRRRNTGRLTGDLIYWSNIPNAMVVNQIGNGSYESVTTEDCRTATLE
jgi:hypothetical protein